MALQVKQKQSTINLQFHKSAVLDAAFSDLIENRAFQFLLHYTSDLVFIFNMQKETITAVNNAVLQKTGSEIHQWAETALSQVPASPSLVHIFKDMLRQLNFEYYIVGKKAKSPWNELAQLTVEGMNFNGLALIIMKESGNSNTSNKKLLQEMKSDQEFLQTEKMASIGRLASGIAHELRNPLTIISATAQFSLERLKLNPQTREHFETIFRNVTNANRIVKEMLEYAKPRELNLHLDNINSIVYRTLDLINLEIQKNNIDLQTKHDKNVPDFHLDSKHLEQTLLNLLLNAIHAIGSDGSIEITTKFDTANQTVILNIKDSGEGIPMEIQERIFEPFYTTRSGGTGLGLSICQNIIHAHGGTIGVQSEQGKGSTFSITMPVRILSDMEESS